jgi:hypothetical protein
MGADVYESMVRDLRGELDTAKAEIRRMMNKHTDDMAKLEAEYRATVQNLYERYERLLEIERETRASQINDHAGHIKSINKSIDWYGIYVLEALLRNIHRHEQLQQEAAPYVAAGALVPHDIQLAIDENYSEYCVNLQQAEIRIGRIDFLEDVVNRIHDPIAEIAAPVAATTYVDERVPVAAAAVPAYVDERVPVATPYATRRAATPVATPVHYRRSVPVATRTGYGHITPAVPVSAAVPVATRTGYGRLTPAVPVATRADYGRLTPVSAVPVDAAVPVVPERVHYHGMRTPIPPVSPMYPHITGHTHAQYRDERPLETGEVPVGEQH